MSLFIKLSLLVWVLLAVVLLCVLGTSIEAHVTSRRTAYAWFTAVAVVMVSYAFAVVYASLTS